MKKYRDYIYKVRGVRGEGDYANLYKKIEARINKRQVVNRLSLASVLAVMLIGLAVYFTVPQNLANNNDDTLMAYIFEPVNGVNSAAVEYVLGD